MVASRLDSDALITAEGIDSMGCARRTPWQTRLGRTQNATTSRCRRRRLAGDPTEAHRPQGRGGVALIRHNTVVCNA